MISAESTSPPLAGAVLLTFDLLNRLANLHISWERTENSATPAQAILLSLLEELKRGKTIKHKGKNENSVSGFL